MSTKNNISRIIIEISKEHHRRLKARAAVLGKSMRELVLEALEASQECIYSDHYPNKETLKPIKNIEEDKNLTEYKSIDDLFNKMGL